MLRFTRITVCLGIASAAFCFAAAPANVPAPLEVKDVLALTDRNQLVDVAIAKVNALTALLERAVDAKSAKQLQPEIERAFFEMEMLNTRATMLPTPGRDQVAKLSARTGEILTAREKLAAESERISRDASIASPLRAILSPFAGAARASADARHNSLISQLQTLRSQIELYKLQHRDVAPDFAKNGWAQLLGKTDAAGVVNDKGPYGPYLQHEPVNYMTNSKVLLIVHSDPKPDFTCDKNTGFVFNDKNNRIWSVTADGKIFDELAPGASNASKSSLRSADIR